jgi:hypothetical protein
MRGPSTQDCEKSFARTGVPSMNLQKKKAAALGLKVTQAAAHPPKSTLGTHPVTWMASVSRS